MTSTRSPVARLVPRLLGQLVPAALAATVGVLLLGNLANPSRPAPNSATVPAAINAEAVFKITPRESAELQVEPAKAAAARVAVKPKALAANIPAPPSPKPAIQAYEPALPPAVVSEPLPILPAAAQVEVAAPVRENIVIGTLRSSARVATSWIPQWSAGSMADWFVEAAPLRPPAPVPTQDFQAAM